MSSNSDSATAPQATVEVNAAQMAAMPQMQQQSPGSFSDAQWKEIYSEKLDNKPVIQHPQLGPVVEVKPGLFVRKVNAEDKFKQHLQEFKGPRMPTDELEKQRFHAMVYARNNGATQLLEKLQTVSTEEEMQLAVKEDRKKVGNIEQAMQHFGEQDTLFKHDPDEANKVLESLKKQGRVLKLKPGSVIDGKVLTREAVNELRDQGFNILVKRSPDQDPYMQKIRQDAANAMAFIEGKIQVDAGAKGVDKDTPEEEKRQLQVALATAANAISLYEREKNVITRHDGDQNIAVRVDLNDYYAKLKADHVYTNDIRQFMHEFGPAIHLSFASSEPKSSELMIFLECLDCAVFVPRLACLFADQPMPRVVEFSRVYNIYRAAAGSLQIINPAPSQTKLERMAKKAKTEIDKIIENDNADVQPANDRVEQANQAIGSWTQQRTSRQQISQGFSQLRLSARLQLLEKVRTLQGWLKKERAFHAASESDQKLMLASGFTTQFTVDEVKTIPNVLILFFYRQLWLYSQEFSIAVLQAYEFSILLQLETYLPKQTKDFWRTVSLLPEEIQCVGITKQKVLENNTHLTRWRTFDSNKVLAAAFKRHIVEIQLVPEIEEQRVDTTQSWSPTVKQIRKYYGDMCSLFQLSDLELRRMLDENNRRQNKQYRRQMTTSLREYFAARGAADQAAAVIVEPADPGESSDDKEVTTSNADATTSSSTTTETQKESGATKKE